MLGRAVLTGSVVLIPGAALAAGESIGGAAAGDPGGGLILGGGKEPPGAGIAGRAPGAVGPAGGKGEGVKLGAGTVGAIGGLVEEGEREGTEGAIGGETAGLGPGDGGVGLTPAGGIGEGVGPPG